MAFTGKATYSAFTDEVAKDVSPIIAERAPIIAPWLDFLGDPLETANVAVGSTRHIWLEDEYAPAFTLTVSTAIASATADTGVRVDGWGDKVQEGDVFAIGSLDTSVEHVLVVSAVGANSILLSRQFGGTTPYSLAPGGTLTFVANVKLEGDDAKRDISTVRVAKENYVQYIAKPVEVSATLDAVTKNGGVISEFSYQAMRRMDEALRDLERSAIRMTNVATVGSSTTRRSMKGAWWWLTNTHTINVNSFAAATADYLDEAITSGWNMGAIDGYDFLLCGVNVKRYLDKTADSRIEQRPEERRFVREMRVYESGIAGPMAIVPSPNIDANAAIIGKRENFQVKPLQGRSFQFKEYAPTEDRRKGEVVGEYTLEVRRASTAVRLYLTS